MEKDKKIIATFFGALVLILIMLITTIININKIAKTFSEMEENDTSSVNSSIDNNVQDDDKEENLILKEGNSSYSREDDE